MAKSIHLEVTTPEGVRLATEVDEVTLPSVSGEFGVLPEHRPLLAGLRSGLVSYSSEKQQHVVAIGPGFARVAEDKVSILTVHFMKKDEVDPIVARKDLKETEQELSALTESAPEEARLRLVAAVRWAAVRLELYGDPPPPTMLLGHEVPLLGHEDYTDLGLEPNAEEPVI
jgi:F-type H+-transporting ATPase subunit epsilon